MPDHIRFLLKHAALGATAGVVFVGLLLAFDIAGLRHLVLNTSGGFIALAVMTVFFVITFGSVQMGRAIMSLGQDETPPSGGRRAPEGQLIPIPVERAPDPRHRPRR
jgi:hypothetical protein